MICKNKRCGMEIPDGSMYCNYCGTNQSSTRSQNTRKRGNGMGTVFKLPNGKYRAEYTVAIRGGKRIRRTKSGFKTKKEALEYLPLLKSEPESAKRITLSDLYDLWSGPHYQKISNSKITHYKKAYERLKPIWYRYIDDLRLPDLQPIIDSTAGDYYPKHDVKVLLNLLYKYAIVNDYCAKNYAEYITLPPLKKSKRDAWTSNEIAIMWDDYEKGHTFTGYFLIMIYTGMRPGELLALETENIHLDEQYMIGGIKTEAGKNREILIANKILPVVSALMPASGKFLAMNKNDFNARFNSERDRMGLRPLTPHCCRHTCATALAEDDVAPAIIKEILGHTNYQTTLGYTHISLAAKLEAVNKI